MNIFYDIIHFIKNWDVLTFQADPSLRRHSLHSIGVNFFSSGTPPPLLNPRSASYYIIL